MHSIKYFNLELDRYLGTDDISFINVNILIVVVKNSRQNDAPHFSGDQVLKLHFFFKFFDFSSNFSNFMHIRDLPAWNSKIWPKETHWWDYQTNWPSWSRLGRFAAIHSSPNFQKKTSFNRNFLVVLMNLRKNFWINSLTDFRICLANI